MATQPVCALSRAGLLVDDATQAYEVSVAHGAKGVRPPTTLREQGAAEVGAEGGVVVSEVSLYGDVVLRYVSGNSEVRGRREGDAGVG
jgi:4-hydroxyphenylpyruvate dioxygenase